MPEKLAGHFCLHAKQREGQGRSLQLGKGALFILISESWGLIFVKLPTTPLP